MKLPDLAIPYSKVSMFFTLVSFLILTGVLTWLLWIGPSDNPGRKARAMFGDYYQEGYYIFFIACILFCLSAIFVFLFRLSRSDNLYVLQWDGFIPNRDILYNRKIYWSEISKIYHLTFRIKVKGRPSLIKHKGIAMTLIDPRDALRKATALNRKLLMINKEEFDEYLVITPETADMTFEKLLSEFQRYWQAWQEWDAAQKSRDKQ